MLFTELGSVINRCNALKAMNQDLQADKERIRMIMNGGTEGVHAVMAWDYGKGSSSRMNRQDVADAYGVDMPTVNLVQSGMERTAQKVGKVPTLKAPAAADDAERRKLEKKMNIVKGWDHGQRFELQFPQMGRWLPGYGHAMWKITGARREGTPYPKASLRDPYDVYPGWYGVDQQPSECLIVRNVPLFALQESYPDLAWQSIEGKLMENRGKIEKGVINLGERSSGGPRSWEGAQTGIEIYEYINGDGTHLYIPEVEATLAMISNPISTPAFVFVNRFSFDKQQSQYHHVIGMMAMMAKLNIMGLIAAEDSVFRELNIFGDLISNGYERGRFAINEFERDAKVERPTGDIPQMMWQQIDRLERQLRIGATYDQSQDGISPTSFATGQSVMQLRGSMNDNIAEYHLAIRHGVERVDSKRLEWANTVWKSSRVKIFDLANSKATYKPSTDIKDSFGTRRIYGAMAGWDDTVKAAVGLQYKGAGVFSRQVIQENVDGLDDAALVNDQITAEQAETALFARLAQRSETDPRGDAALVELMLNPSQKANIVKKYFAPEEVEGQEEDMAALQQLQGMAGPDNAALDSLPRESASTVLSQVELGGGVQGGVQTVGRV